jgi:ankyrin repeat protein
MEKSKGRIRQAFAKIKKKLFSRRQPKVEEKQKIPETRTKFKLSDMLRHAVIFGDEREAALAIKAGADINEIYEFNMTPLMYAAYNADPKMCLFLIRNGADTEKLNYRKSPEVEGINALTYAAKGDPPGGQSSIKDRLATCLVLILMGSNPIVKEREWSLSDHVSSSLPLISLSEFANLSEGRNALAGILGASAKPFADAFFGCIYGNRRRFLTLGKGVSQRF